MSGRARAAKSAATAAAAVILLTGCDFSASSLPLPGGPDLGDHPYSVSIEFRSIAVVPVRQSA